MEDGVTAPNEEGLPTEIPDLVALLESHERIVAVCQALRKLIDPTDELYVVQKSLANEGIVPILVDLLSTLEDSEQLIELCETIGVICANIEGVMTRKRSGLESGFQERSFNPVQNELAEYNGFRKLVDLLDSDLPGVSEVANQTLSICCSYNHANKVAYLYCLVRDLLEHKKQRLEQINSLVSTLEIRDDVMVLLDQVIRPLCGLIEDEDKNTKKEALFLMGTICEGHPATAAFLCEEGALSSVVQIIINVFSGNITATDLLFYQELRSLNGIHTKVEYVENWSLRIGGAHIVEVRPEIVFQFGSIILVDDILIDSSRITPSYMEIAEYVADIGPFDENEINSAAEAAMENIECFRKIRSVKLAVDTPWLFKFQPFQETPRRLQPIEACPEKRMKKFNVPSSSRKYRSRFDDSNILWKIPKDIKLPKKKSDLAFMSILELASLLRQGLVTSVELTQLYLSRLRKSDVYLKAVITYTEELALQKAQQADREMKMGIFRTPLHGIPYGLKDIIAVPGYPTTWGSKALQNQTFKEASWVYKKLSGAGAVHVAKLATGAMAWGDAWFGGKTKNPWNIQESSCGSSSGSGATASAGLIPFSIGTETWGSIACPASAMGITAIRPTFGSVGRSGTMQLAWSLDKIGAFCRTAIDCAIVLDSLRGADPNDSSSIYAPMTNPQSIKPHKLTIGYTVNSDPDVVRQFEEELGLQMELMNLNIDYPTDEIINILVGAEASGSFDEWIRENEISSLSNDEKWIAFVRGARLIPVAEYLLANKVRSELIAFESKLLSTVDAILVPAKGAGNQGALGNLLGIPEVVFPTGFDTIYGSGYSQRKIPKTQVLVL
eukprot:g9180.t2